MKPKNYSARYSNDTPIYCKCGKKNELIRQYDNIVRIGCCDEWITYRKEFENELEVLKKISLKLISSALSDFFET